MSAYRTEHLPIVRGGLLAAEDFIPIAVGGFGKPENAQAHSMAWFQGRFYVSTTCRARGAEKKDKGDRRKASLPDLDQRGQIWQYDPQLNRWEMVFQSSDIRLPDNRVVPRHTGYRGMVVFQGRSDPTPALYVSTLSPFGSLILRTEDGRTYRAVSTPGLGNPQTRSFRALTEFLGRLYTSPAGQQGAERIERNSAGEAVVLESDDPATGMWRPVSQHGFGNSTNRCIFEMCSFNGHLYAGTGNPYTGFEIWKTCEPGLKNWTKVLSAGAFRGKSNESVASMVAFRDALYVGTGIQGFGYDKAFDAGPAASELIRIHPDDSWDLIVGEPRKIVDGIKRPISGLGPGFDNPYNSIFWKMVEHQGWLYVGTHDWSVRLIYFLSICNAVRPRLARWIRNELAEEGGFDLWCSRDGEEWMPVTKDGFGNPHNYGVRTLCSASHGLFVGTVTLPSVFRALENLGRKYPADCQIWLGRSNRS